MAEGGNNEELFKDLNHFLKRERSETPTGDAAEEWLRDKEKVKGIAIKNVRVKDIGFAVNQVKDRILSGKYAEIMRRWGERSGVDRNHVDSSDEKWGHRLAENTIEEVNNALNKLKEDPHLNESIPLLSFLPTYRFRAGNFNDEKTINKEYRDITSGDEGGTIRISHKIGRAAVLKLLGFKLDKDNQIMGRPITKKSYQLEDPEANSFYRTRNRLEKIYKSPENPNIFLNIMYDQPHDAPAAISETIRIGFQNIVTKAPAAVTE